MNLLKHLQHYSTTTIRARLTLVLSMGVLLLFSAMILIKIFGLPAGIYKGEYRSREEEAISRLSVFADELKARVTEWFDERQGDARSLVRNRQAHKMIVAITAVQGKEAREGLREYRDLRDQIKQIRDAHAIYASIDIVDLASGWIVLSTDDRQSGHKAPYDLELTALLRQHGQESIFFNIDKNSRTLHLNICTVISGAAGGQKNGKIAAVLFRIRMDDMTRQLLRPRQSLGSSSEVIFVTMDRLLITPLRHTLPDGSIATPLAYRLETEPARYATWGVAGVVSAPDYRGVPVIAVVRHLRPQTDFGIGMIVKQDRQEIMAPIYKSMYSSAVIMLIGLLLMLFTLYAATARLLRPLEQLSEAARRIRQGDLNARSQAAGTDEIGALSHSFNAMADTYQDRHQEMEREIRKRTAELVASETKLKLIFNSSRDAIGVSLQGKHVLANPAYVAMFGYDDPASVMALSVLDLIAKSERPRILDFMRKRAAGENVPGSYETLGLRKDGTEFSMDVSVSSYRIQDDQYTLVLLRDITAHKQADAILKKERDRAQQYLDTVEAIIVALDANGSVTMVNRKGCEILGFRESEIVGRNWFEQFLPRPEGREPAYAIFQKIMAGNIKETTYFENAIITRSGEQRTIAWHNSSLRDADGRIVGTLSAGEDNTERKKLEDQLRQAQKMEAVGVLAGGVAHDFNNILSAIVGYASLIQMKIKADIHLRQMVDQVLASTERAAELTKSLLAFSRKQVVELKPLNVNDLLYQFHKIMVRLVSEDIEFRLNLCGETLMVSADKGQLEQVLMNLVANARDAMPKGGTLIVTTESVKLEEDQGDLKQGSFAAISVSDTGLGMENTTVEHIFEPFYTTKEVGKGTGLGLAIVHGIIMNHKGVIHVSSEPGKGTTFKLWIPLHVSVSAANIPPRFLPPPRGTEVILLVEDDPAVREATRRILEEHGYSVLTAIDGEDAIAAFRANKERIQLVLCDVIMPRKNGREAVEEIKRMSPAVKVLFMSGYTADIISQRGLLQEDFHFISKPLNPSDLLKTMRDVLRADH
jgi:PAS domain S-box-containing protein